ncbi:MAG: CHASE2 domain-containing protein [Fischerella sp.]|nr:CHASE2 domain-containing protein [Fischerella sp.]
MSKLVVISLLGGDLNRGFPVVTAQLWDVNQSFPMKFTGSLPAVPELGELYKRWRLLYEAVHDRLGSNHRIKVHSQDITNISVHDFDDVCQQLKASINAWLNSESFQNIERQLRTLLSPNDEIRVIFETNVALLHRLPCHLWNFFEDYPKAELALSNQEYTPPQIIRKSPTNKVKILAILGNSFGIEVEKDRSLLQNLAGAETEFLVEPTRREVDEQLWNHNWDILFFAGHSVSVDDGETGQIYINQDESLTVSQLKNALKAAITRGLKLAIFNSCDGIGLARDLADLNIPQMIVMREGVPDLVAQEFLKNFLPAFAAGKAFYPAVREARERLQGLENDFPCASWLPVICQNPTTVPVTWQQLCSGTSDATSNSRKSKVSTRKRNLWTILLSIAIATTSAIGLRYFGVFEKAELQSFDQMLVLRPQEEPDPRLLIVEITEKDIQSRQEITLGSKSISDNTLAQLLNQLQKYQPRVIGVDIYQDSTDPQDQSSSINLASELSNENIVVVCKGRDSTYDPQGVKPPDGVPVERQGFTDAIHDPDGIVRRQILMMAQEPSSVCETPHSLSFQLAARYLFYENITPELTEDYIKFDTKVIKRLKSGRSGGYQQGTDLGGFQILINYRNAYSPRISLADVLSGKLNSDLVKNKVILIGVTANSNSDAWSTPYSGAQQSYQRIPGVLIQAQMTSQILSAVLDQRPILGVLPYWGDILWIFGWSLAATLMLGRNRSFVSKGCIIITTLFILYGVCLVIIFVPGLWVPFIPSAFAVVTGSTVMLFAEKR